MYTEIDTKLSIQKRKVVRKLSVIEKIWDGICQSIFFLIPSTMIFVILERNLDMDTLNTQTIFGCVTFLTIGLRIGYSTLKLTRLKRVIGLPVQNDIMPAVKTAAENLGWETVYHNGRFSGFVRRKWLSWDYGKELTVVYDGNQIWINCVALARGGIYSPFHWLATLNAEKKFVKEVRRLLAAGKNL